MKERINDIRYAVTFDYRQEGGNVWWPAVKRYNRSDNALKDLHLLLSHCPERYRNIEFKTIEGEE